MNPINPKASIISNHSKTLNLLDIRSFKVFEFQAFMQSFYLILHVSFEFYTSIKKIIDNVDFNDKI